MASFAVPFSFMLIHLFIFVFVVKSKKKKKKIIAKTNVKEIISYVFFFTGSGFTFKCLIHFKLVILCGVR